MSRMIQNISTVKLEDSSCMQTQSFQAFEGMQQNYLLLLLLAITRAVCFKRSRIFLIDDQWAGKTCRGSQRIFDVSTKTELQCSALCLSNAGCGSFSHDTKHKRCIGCKRILQNEDESIAVGPETVYYAKVSNSSFTNNGQISTPTLCDLRLDMKGMGQYCDEDGWIVFHKRVDDIVSFDRTWDEYSKGFGDINRGTFWMGLEHVANIIHSNNKAFQLRVDLEDHTGNITYALYQDFGISGSDDKYRLHVGQYSGNAGDGLKNYPHGPESSNGQMFSTKDADNDLNDFGNCADEGYGGWWYHACTWSNLNGAFPVTFWAHFGQTSIILQSSMKFRDINTN